jgi:NADPH:quinone reductase-like Zn-dependent oxidoreductase
VNMLRIADTRPDILQRCLLRVVDLAGRNEIKPHVGGRFPAAQLAEAHAFLESGKSTGKIIVSW